MAIDYSAEIEAVKLAIASGATTVSYEGKSVSYGSRQDLLARLRWLETQLSGVVARPTAAYASFSRGDC